MFIYLFKHVLSYTMTEITLNYNHSMFQLINVFIQVTSKAALPCAI